MKLNNANKYLKIPDFPKIPLFFQALTDPQISFFLRPGDNAWKYNGFVRYSTSGFNPFTQTIYQYYDSCMAAWMRNGMRNYRRFNQNDNLTREILFFIHDYLHCWSNLVIQDVMPELKFGYGEINDESIEKYSFCHLLTEAAATVGLDYWYLSTLDELDNLLEVGTDMHVLTVNYKEKDLKEYRKFCENLTVQKPEMFEVIAKFYCTGVFHGFSGKDVHSSLKLSTWLSHELTYGVKQREYIREWLCYLSNGKVNLKRNDLSKPLVINKPWQKKLMKILSLKLWDLVKNNKNSRFKRTSSIKHLWKKNLNQDIDLRFTNFSSLSRNQILMIIDMPRYSENFDYLFAQSVSALQYKKISLEMSLALKYVQEKRELAPFLNLMQKSKSKLVKHNRNLDQKRADLFFIN